MFGDDFWLLSGDGLKGGGGQRDLSRPLRVYVTVWWSKGSKCCLKNEIWSHFAWN